MAKKNDILFWNSFMTGLREGPSRFFAPLVALFGLFSRGYRRMFHR